MAKATKIKIRIRKAGFRLPLPALRFKFISRVCNLVLKFPMKEVDPEEVKASMNILLTGLADLEPFVLAEVSDASENVYIRIETL